MNGSLGGCVVTTTGRGSMDAYGRQLADRLPSGVDRLELDVTAASADLFNVPALGRASLQALVADARVVRTLRRRRSLLHLTNHHLARYAHALPGPFLLTVHDLIRWFDARGTAVHISAPNRRDRVLVGLDHSAISKAAAVIAVSDTTRRDLVHHLGIPPERITTVYEGIDHELFRPVRQRPVAGPYVLFVGSEHPRKNLATLLRAFAQLKRDHRLNRLRLVKVGAAGSGEAPFRQPTVALLQELGIGSDVIFTEEVPDADLPAYYSGATCLVLPSRYEGFGFPPLEAMACGCPVIVSTAGSLPEVSGGAALTCDPDDEDGLAEHMRRVVTDEALGVRMRQEGLRRAAEFSWDKAAQETAAVYEATLGRLRAGA